EARPYLVRAYVLAPAQHREPLRRNLEQLELGADELTELERADAARGDPAAALAWIERLLAAEPGRGEAALERARLLRRLGRDDDAVAAFRAQADAAPASYEIWSELGTYLHALGRDDEARPVIEHALTLELPPEFPSELREGSKERLRKLLE